MVRLTSNILLDDQKYRFTGVGECIVTSTFEALTDTATIALPYKKEWQLRNLVFGDNPILKRGLSININMGYDDNNYNYFNGYVSKIEANNPILISCQDQMYNLKLGSFTNSYRKVTLSQLLKDMLPNVSVDVVADYDLGKWRTPPKTPAQILESLNKDYFIRFFFRNNVLYAGLAIVPKLQKTHKVKYVFLENNRLEYVKKEDVKIKLKGVIMYPDNTSKIIEVGDMEGEQRTFHRYDISESEMLRLLEQEIETLRYDGFKGSFEMPLDPNINHGDIVQLPANLHNVEQAGSYIVRKVVKQFDGSHAKQIIELERKV